MRSIRPSVDFIACVALVALATGLIVTGVACTDPLRAPLATAHPNDPTPRRGGTLQLASMGEPRGFDPAAASDGVATPIVDMLFDGLVDYDLNAHIVAVLAERWEVLDGGAKFRFYLRQDVRFHDGEELTADDVRRSIERALHPSTPNPYASFYSDIEGYDAYIEKKRPHLSGISVEGRYVVSIALAHADATFLARLALHVLRPVCRSAGERYSPDWHPCGAGPFRLPTDGWQRGSSVTIVRHEGYFRPGRPYLDAIRWTVLSAPITQRLKFDAGEIDFLRDFSSPDYLRFRSDPRWAPYEDDEGDATVSGEAMNTELAPFDNVEIRRAVAAAIDRSHYAALKPGSMRPANQLLPPSISGRDDAAVGQTYDYAAALEHMRRAGYPYDPKTQKGGYPNDVWYVGYEPGLDYYSSQLLAQDLGKIGIRLRIRMLSYATFLAVTHRAGRAQMMLAGWAQDYPDPSDFFDPLFASSAINGEDTNNVAFYRNRELDALLAKARGVLDASERRRMYERAGEIVADDAPWAFTHYFHSLSVHQPYVRGYRPHPVSITYMADVWLDRAAVVAQRRASPLFRDALAGIFGHSP